MLFAPARKVSPLSILFGHLFLWLILAGVAAGAAAGIAAVFTGVAPLFTARVVGPLFCPEAAAPSLVTIYGATYRDSDNVQRQQQTQVIKCADAQGQPVEGTGASFALVWYGGWIAGLVALVSVIYFIWAVVTTVASLMRKREDNNIVRV